MTARDTSVMTDPQIEDLIAAHDMLFVTIIWLVPVPAKANPKRSV
jgi:hypothetical protein